MFSRPSLNELKLACPVCKEVFRGREVLFVCPEPRCSARSLELPGRPPEWYDRPVFPIREFSHSVQCPYSLHQAHRKLCPRCWSELPPSSGDLSTVAVIGSSASGKTCYMTALIHQIQKRLARADSYRMSLEWDDDAGRRYFDGQYDTIFNHHLPPDQTQREGNLQAVQITIRFPRRAGWFGPARSDPYGVVSLVLPDPSGEYFDLQEDVYYLNYLGHARAIILMVDPMMSEKYRRTLTADERLLLDYKAAPPDVALGNFVKALRREANQHTGRIDKQLAVVLTKCDERGMFDPDDPKFEDQFPRQGRSWDVKLAEEISRHVVRHLREELEMNNLVSLAENSFREVCFFAVSALGRTPVRRIEKGRMVVRLEDPSPRRVEEPLLWILERWGYL